MELRQRKERHDVSILDSIKAPTSQQTTSAEFTRFLRKLHRACKAFLFSSMLSFTNSKSAKRWQKLSYDCQRCYCATVEQFLRTPKLEKKAWFALAVLPPSKYVGTSTQGDGVRDQWWHCVAVGVIENIGTGNKRGKAMIIYDCDIPDCKPSSRAEKMLKHGVLLLLWRELRRIGTPSLWINKRKPEESGRQQCVKLACNRLIEWIKFGDQAFQGRGDPRLKGGFHCVLQA